MRLARGRKSTRTRRQQWLKTTLVQAARAPVKKKAIVALAASMLTAAYHMLRNDVDYQDLGAEHFQRRNREKAAFLLVRRLGNLACDVQLHTAA